ncbi:hypothetical protein AX14_002457 [Amanita brunnescens Koide BX004]|nr:hypothetical protein AX14_002457 [Amanita brunnescens Koide BX004]
MDRANLRYQDGHQVASIRKVWAGDLYIRSVCFSPDANYWPPEQRIMQIRIWDIAKKRIMRVFDGYQQEIYSLDFSLDGRLIVSRSGDKTARILTPTSCAPQTMVSRAQKTYDYNTM